MDTNNLKPGDEVAPCQEAPTLRVVDREGGRLDQDLQQSEGYTSRGYVRHFLPDREVNLAHLNQALADVFGEPAVRIMKMNVEIDENMWRQVCSDPWSGNIYRYAFRSPDTPIVVVEDLVAMIQRLQSEIQELKQRLG